MEVGALLRKEGCYLSPPAILDEETMGLEGNPSALGGTLFCVHLSDGVGLTAKLGADFVQEVGGDCDGHHCA